MYNFKRKRGQFGGEISSCDVIMHKDHSPVLLGTDHLISETAGIGGRVGQFLRSKIFFSTSISRNLFRNITLCESFFHIHVYSYRAIFV